MPALHFPLCKFDEVAADAVSDTPRPAVQHYPDALGFVETKLDEVVTGTERTQMLRRVGLLDLGVLFGDDLETNRETCPGCLNLGRHVVPRASVTRATVGGT